MATHTYVQEDEPQNARRNAPRTSDTITRRGHPGPVPLPTDSAFIPIGIIPASPQGTAPTYASPPYQTQGSIMPAYPDHSRTHGTAPLAAYPSFPSIHLSQADYTSSPAQQGHLSYAPPPRQDPLATPRGRAQEAWRLFRMLGEHPSAPVPSDVLDGFSEIISWLRYFAASFQRVYLWARHVPFFSNTRCARELADLLRATRDLPENNDITLERYDLTDVVARAERSGQAPLQLLMNEGISFATVEREPPITIG
ncbi:hypothetical protein K525DRAFT_150218, partial [Schizophyllum commune Loenen D]